MTTLAHFRTLAVLASEAGEQDEGMYSNSYSARDADGIFI